jgi:DNA-binding NarL/FixJ family response regulator
MRNVTDECLQIVIGDGHPMFVDGIRALIHTIETLSIVAEVSTGSAAYRSILEFGPHIAILDSAMAGMRGLAIVEQLRADAEGTAVIILSDCEETTYVHRVLATGVRGYVLKRSTGSSIIEAVHAVSRGGLYLDPAVAAQIIPTGGFGASGVTGRKPNVRALTDREREVLRLIALGFTNKEVAGRLGITTKSIETYKTRATDKLDIHSRAKIVQYAMIQGWLESPLP